MTLFDLLSSDCEFVRELNFCRGLSWYFPSWSWCLCNLSTLLVVQLSAHLQPQLLIKCYIYARKKAEEKKAILVKTFLMNDCKFVFCATQNSFSHANCDLAADHVACVEQSKVAGKLEIHFKSFVCLPSGRRYFLTDVCANISRLMTSKLMFSLSL